MKNLVTGVIPEPNREHAFADAAPGRTVFSHFQDDDIGGSKTFEDLYDYLYHHHFPRIAWALHPEFRGRGR